MTNTTTTTDATIATSGAKPDDGKTRVELYTDGAAQPNPGPGGWGFVALLIAADGSIIEAVERNAAGGAITTNNRAEMAGAVNALAFVSEQQATGAWPVCPITVISDSQILVKGFTEWLPNWIARGWRKSNGREPDNRDLWERLQATTEGLTVGWRWIKGHNGNRWNERADELAEAAAEQAGRRGVSFRSAGP